MQFSKILKYAGAAFGGVFILALLAVYLYLSSLLPTRAGELLLPGMTAEAEVYYDNYGVPHILAKNESDAYRVLGFVHAQDRLFQMELLRRIGKGELAEILGPELLKTDRFFRTLGIGEYARNFAKNVPDNSVYRAQRAYLDGVNHYMKTGPTPIEFTILGITPRPFDLSDTIAISGYMSYTLSRGGFRTDSLLTFIAEKFGDEYLTDLGFAAKKTPRDFPEKPVADSRVDNSANLKSLAKMFREVDRAGAGIPEFFGSNAWALSRARTASGRTLLGGDPHMSLSMPSVWYEAHIHTPEFELYGHHLAGIGIPLLGLNHHIAWSLTMFKNDDVDFYREVTNPDNKNQVRFKDTWEDLSIRSEVIKIKGGAQETITVRSSRHGPIINDVVYIPGKKKSPVALSWTFLDPGNDLLGAFYELGHARTPEAAARAAEKIYAPGLNIIYADAKGNIAWWAAARLPRRRAGGRTKFFLDGAGGQDEWNGFYPFSQNPQAINPPEGFVVSANEAPVWNKSGRLVPGYYSIFDRSARIREGINKKGKGITPADTKTLQLADRIEYHRPLQRTLRSVLGDDPHIKKDKSLAVAFDIFSKWDGGHGLDSRGASLFAIMRYHLYELILKDELGEDFFKLFLDTSLSDRALLSILETGDSPYWDNVHTKAVETRRQILLTTLEKTVFGLSRLTGPDPEDWRWGNIHTLEWTHLIGRKKPMNIFFNVGPFQVPGGREALNNLKGKQLSGLQPVTVGPSTRRVIDFSAPEKSAGILPGGQSGYFFDKHYDDQTEMYVRGEYRAHLLNLDEIKKTAASRLLFKGK